MVMFNVISKEKVGEKRCGVTQRTFST